MNLSLDRLREDFDPTVGITALLVFPPALYIASLWLSGIASQHFATCTELFGGTAGAVFEYPISLGIVLWGLSLTMCLTMHLFAGNEAFHVGVRRFAEGSALLHSALAMIPLLMQAIACI